MRTRSHARTHAHTQPTYPASSSVLAARLERLIESLYRSGVVADALVEGNECGDGGGRVLQGGDAAQALGYRGGGGHDRVRTYATLKK